MQLISYNTISNAFPNYNQYGTQVYHFTETNLQSTYK